MLLQEGGYSMLGLLIKDFLTVKQQLRIMLYY